MTFDSRSMLKGAMCIASAVTLAGLSAPLAYADNDDPQFQAPSTSETGTISSRSIDIQALPSDRCTALSNGDLCVIIVQGSSGSSYKNIRVGYTKYSGSQIHAYQGYSANGAEVTGPYFYLSAGSYRTDTWNNRYLPGCPGIVGFLYADGQGRFQTPAAPSC
ncbi:hypothetical protein ACQP1K_25245 [Sphaerimonospora sp. CA-214678]|uniref:hypothetical protein n=1 Tax=Sphaerimonospora sp. CA-214678 TaxID=3240029 RepID=UPI003D8D81B3